MQQSVRCLLSDIIDYAGMFPPQGLPLEQAVRNYARFSAEPEAWMLSRFVCPATRLAELPPLCAELFTPERPLRLSVIGNEHPLSPEFIKDVRLIDTFTRAHGERARIEALELRIPAETIAEWDPEVVAEGLNVLASRLVDHRFSDIEVFIEPSFPGNWNESVEAVVAALARHNIERGTPAPERIGFKLRTGGPAADAFPTVEQVAFALLTCRDARIPLKFTGGLHHALFQTGATPRSDMHGIINVFAAGVIAHARDADAAMLCELLREHQVDALTFEPDGFHWLELDVTIAEIELARQELVLSFGSCGFEGPCSELRQLGLI